MILRSAALLLAVAATTVPLRAEEAPDWLDAARSRPVSGSLAIGKSPIVVLFEEDRLEIARSDTRARVREAARIMTVEGQRNFALAAPQRLGQDFRLVGAWRIRPDGEVTRYGTKAIVQVDADSSYEFSMSKVNMFHPDEARVGDVLAWEYSTRGKSEAHQTQWPFAWNRPVLLSRFALKVPAGWTVSSMMRNGPGMPSAKDDEGYTFWEARDIPAAKEEPMGIPLRDAVPTLLVRWAPPEGQPDHRRFDTWESVGSWYAGLVAPQVVADPGIRRTAAQASGGASDKLSAIRGIARFVQGVRYVDTAVGRSTAEPHPAPQILRNRFGDCEDKSVLTLALLREIGVEAYPMLALTGDDGSVTPEFPAPNVFNHAIVAIKAPAEVQGDLPSTIDAGPVGRLIIFDPTSSTTGLGDLPYYLQGTFATLAHATYGGLVTLPRLPPETSLRESLARVAFPARGGVDVTLSARFDGQYAALMRSRYESVRGEKRKEDLLSWLAGHYGEAEIRKLEVTGVEIPDEPIRRDLDFWMPVPGKELGTLRTMTASFHMFTRADRLIEAQRETPLRIEASWMESDHTVLEIPDGWKVLDPLPSAEASSDAGSYSMRSRRDGGAIVVERTLKVNAITVPPSGYPPVRRFFDEVMKGDASGIAMEKSPG